MSVDGGDGGEQQPMEEDAAAPAAVAGAAHAEGGIPAGCFPSAAGGGAWWKPSWVRCTGGRLRDDDDGDGGEDGEGGARKKKKFNAWYKGVDPVWPVEDPAIAKMLEEFYGIEPGFPLSTHLITRCLDKELPKRLYYVSDGLLKLLLADEQEALKVTSTGLKIFERHELKDRAKARKPQEQQQGGQQQQQQEEGGAEEGGGKQQQGGADADAAAAAGGEGEGEGDGKGSCSYRLVQEGLPFILPHITKQVMSLPLEDFKLLLTGRNLALIAGGKPGAPGAPKPPPGSEEADAAADVAEPQQQQKPPAPLSEAAKAELEKTACGGAVARLAPGDAEALGLAAAAGGGGDGGDDDGGALAANAPPAVCVWRTRASLGVLVTKAESDDMLERIADAEKRRVAAAKQLAAAVGGGGKAAKREPAVAAV